MPQLWAEEFGLEAGVPAVVAEAMNDDSWHNDICPKFRSKLREGIVLWVDFPDPADREMGGSRYSVCLWDEEVPTGKTVLNTEDLSEALAKVTELEALDEAAFRALL